jgi:site-specific recombinase XerD
MAIQSGADVKAVQRMLGHASASMTLDLYGHLWDAGLDDVAQRMGTYERADLRLVHDSAGA